MSNYFNPEFETLSRAEIEALQEQVAAKRAQIRSLRAAQKEEEKKRIFEAIEKSGKNAEEILALLEMD